MKRSYFLSTQFFKSRNCRLLISVFAAIVAFFAGFKLPFGMHFIVTWIAFAISNLIMSWTILLSFHPKEVKEMSKDEDSSAPVIFSIVLTAAIFSLFAIILLLQNISGLSKRGVNAHILLSFAAVFFSWTLIHTMFTLRYAHLYYSYKDENSNNATALIFPDNYEDPDYLDFAYFSFVIGMTFQVSDVNIRSKSIRHFALLHGFLSFIFNTVIVALSINIVSGLISK